MVESIKFRKSIHSKEHLTLRNFWIKQRQNLGLSQRALADKLNITHSLIGKIEMGDRRLDVVEMIDYTKALEVGQHTVIDLLPLVKQLINTY